MAKRIIRPAEAQARLGIGNTQFWEWIKKGKLPKPVRLGRRSVGHPESEIDAFIDKLIADRDSASAA
jgi:prophage regulatory protein